MVLQRINRTVTTLFFFKKILSFQIPAQECPVTTRNRSTGGVPDKAGNTSPAKGRGGGQRGGRASTGGAAAGGSGGGEPPKKPGSGEKKKPDDKVCVCFNSVLHL